MVTNKLLIIARHEYITNFKRPIYLFSAFGMPLIIGVVMYVVFAVIIDAETNLDAYQSVGYVDLSTEQLLAEVEADDRFIPFDDEVTARQALEAETIDAYFVVSEDYMLNGGQIDFYAPTDDLPEALIEEIEALMIVGLRGLLPPENPVAQLGDPFAVSTFRILSDGSSFSGQTDLLARLFVPFGFGFFMFTTITITAQFLMSGVVEEKENRMMEVFTTSCTVYDMLWGKMLGLGAIGLTQVAVWSIFGGVIGIVRGDVGDFIASAGYDAADVIVLLGLYTLTYILFAGIATAVGAIFTAEQEARTFAVVFNLTAIAPLMFVVAFIESNSPIAIVFLLIPLTAPISILLSMAYGTVSMAWIYLSIVLLVTTIGLVLWGGARLFRVGMLMYGQRLSPQQILTALRRGVA